MNDNKLASYVIKTYILLLSVIGSVSSILLVNIIAFNTYNENGELMPLSSGTMSLLLIENFFIILSLVYVILKVRLLTKDFKNSEEKISILMENKAKIRSKFYLTLLLIPLPAIFLIINNFIGSQDLKTMQCNIYKKDFTESKKLGISYYLNFKCESGSKYRLNTNKENWNKIPEGTNIYVQFKKGALGIEQIKKINY